MDSDESVCSHASAAKKLAELAAEDDGNFTRSHSISSYDREVDQLEKESPYLSPTREKGKLMSSYLKP